MKILEILGLKKPDKPKSRLIKLLTVFFILLILILLLVIPVLAYQLVYKDKIYVGVYIDSVNVGGLTREDAIDKLNQHVDNLKSRGLDFYWQNDRLNVDITTVSPTDPDLASQLVNFEIEQMVEQAFNYGRQGESDQRLEKIAKGILWQYQIPLAYTLEEAGLKEILKQKFSQFEKPPVDAKIIFEPNGQIKIGPDNDGFIMNYDQAINSLKENINLISLNAIELKIQPATALVRQKEVENLVPQIKEILSLGKLTLKYNDKTWVVEPEEYKNWLVFKKENNEIKLGFDPALLGQKLDSIGQEINIPPQDAKFVITENKVTEFTPSILGSELDKENSLLKIDQEFFANKNSQIDILVKESEPNIKTGDSNTLGVKELIGKGVSDFAGSHTNRIKNIKNAVNHLNGLIIPPGEFSTIEAIGDVNASTGYFQEYVIKGDRTIPEYGGGLCQIGTTMFRAALYSGLPITERRPHSYIVSYYKPLGMDATVYGPHPDLRFMNDTGSNILLQIKIEGTQLTFEFWGTSDGRKVEITDPQLYNWTSQPADRLIENPKLKPGDKKLMETGRRGADAHFNRNITKADDTKTEEIFRSHYVPWPNIYEVGIQPKVEGQPTTDGTTDATSSSSASAGQSGSTNQNINSAQ